MTESSVITTARLRIEPFTTNHLSSRYVAWLQDPDVVRYSEQRYRTHTLQSCREYAESFTGTPNRFWAIIEVTSGLGHIGNMNAYMDPRHLVADLGILIGEKEAWGKGYASEAWRAVCNHLFAAGMRKITAGTLSVNYAMLQVMRNADMKPDGCRVHQCLWEGREVDILHMALFRHGTYP